MADIRVPRMRRWVEKGRPCPPALPPSPAAIPLPLLVCQRRSPRASAENLAKSPGFNPDHFSGSVGAQAHAPSHRHTCGTGPGVEAQAGGCNTTMNFPTTITTNEPCAAEWELGGGAATAPESRVLGTELTEKDSDR